MPLMGSEVDPNVVRVGAPTAGYIHFGNNGYLPLPHSGVVVQMAFSYNSYRDKRFLEKVGISPHITVAEGENALEVALEHYHRGVRKKLKR